MATNLAAPTVIAGGDALAADWNSLRADVVKNAGDFEVTGGTGTAYTLAVDSSIVAYTEGDKFRMQLSADCGATPTLNVNAIGAKTMKKRHDDDIVPGDFLTDQIIEVVYQLNDDIFEVLTPSTTEGSTKLSIDASNVTLNTSVVETDLASFSLAANTLNTAFGVKIEIPITDLGIIRNSQVTLRLKYGATTVATAIIDNNDSGTSAIAFTGWSGKIEAFLFGTGATNTQEGSILVQAGNSTPVPNINQSTHLTDCATGTAVEVSTSALTLAISAEWDASSATNTITIPHYIATVIR